MTGRRRSHEGFRSASLGNSRTITVHLPPGYDEGGQRYPVLYLHDGQNVFDAGRAAFGVSWQAADTADALARAGRIRPTILVGIDSTDARVDEYALWPDRREKAGGQGGAYAQFVFEELKPFIDREYRTLADRTHIGVAGSSLGGLVTLTMALRYHDRFARCGVLSPALWWANGRALDEVEADPAWTARLRWWLCMGTREGRGRAHVTAHLRHTRRLVGLFDRARMLPGRDYCYWEAAGGEHNEAAWAVRFDKVLLYLFGW